MVLLVGAACVPARSENPDLIAAKDLDPAPAAIRVALTAKVTRVQFGSAPPTEAWTYNGTVPGPLIEARVGDRLTVEFRNELPEATTIHWHGVRVPNAMDGVPLMMEPVQPGATFTYEFTLKDAGLFWFHPHMRADIQVQRGLYGVLRVRGDDESAADTERILVLDDLKLKEDGSISEYLDDTSAMAGRQGNTLLVNGAVHPVLTLPAGGVARLRIVNTANARYFRLGADGIQFDVADDRPYAIRLDRAGVITILPHVSHRTHGCIPELREAPMNVPESTCQRVLGCRDGDQVKMVRHQGIRQDP